MTNSQKRHMQFPVEHLALTSRIFSDARVLGLRQELERLKARYETWRYKRIECGFVIYNETTEIHIDNDIIKSFSERVRSEIITAARDPPGHMLDLSTPFFDLYMYQCDGILKLEYTFLDTGCIVLFNFLDVMVAIMDDFSK